jgi:hypothetical protein
MVGLGGKTISEIARAWARGVCVDSDTPALSARVSPQAESRAHPSPELDSSDAARRKHVAGAFRLNVNGPAPRRIRQSFLTAAHVS